MKRSIGRWGCLLAVLTMSCPSASLADWVDNFEGDPTNNYLEQTWLFGHQTGSGGTSSTFDAAVDGAKLVLQDETPPAAGGAFIGFGVVPETFGNAMVSGIVNPAEEGDMNAIVGLLGRTDPVDMTGYILTVTYDPGEWEGHMDISRADGGGTYVSLTSDPFIAGSPGSESYYLELEMRGPNLEGRVYDSPGGTLLHSLSTVDTNYASGYSGVVVSADPAQTSILQPLKGAFDFVASATVPEPSTMLLLVLGGSVLAVGRRRLFGMNRRRCS